MREPKVVALFVLMRHKQSTGYYTQRGDCCQFIRKLGRFKKRKYTLGPHIIIKPEQLSKYRIIDHEPGWLFVSKYCCGSVSTGEYVKSIYFRGK